MRAGGIYNPATQAVFGVPVLGGLCLEELAASPEGRVADFGRAQVLPILGNLVQSLHHALAWI
jgi:hypothetical protein